MMGGFSNNPNAYQVEKAIRRIIIHQEVVASDGANCEADDIPVLQVSSSSSSSAVKGRQDNEVTEVEDEEEMYNDLYNFQNVEITSKLVNDTVVYIAGYISFHFKKSMTQGTCQTCAEIMTEVDSAYTCPLIQAKTRNDALRTTPSGIRKICH